MSAEVPGDPDGPAEDPEQHFRALAEDRRKAEIRSAAKSIETNVVLVSILIHHLFRPWINVWIF
jgi:hypothetical protein